jgi:CRISPR-associated protein Csm4
MAQWTLYRLEPKPGAGFHFGLRGLEGEESAAHCPSDTLFAALVTVLGEVAGADGLASFVNAFAGETPPFLFTSAFPRAGDLPLLPLPFLPIALTPQPGQRKLLKRLRYVSPAIFRRIIAGQPLDEYAGTRGAFLNDGQVWIAAEEMVHLPVPWQKLAPDRLREQPVWRTAVVDRVTVDRTSSASAVYRIGRTVYAPGCGLWVGVRWPGAPDPAAQEQWETLLAHLGDRGLGGKRSVGYGQFASAPLPTALDLPEATAGRPALTLSRYLPAPQELPAALQGAAAYRLEAVAGWLNAPGHKAQRRKQVRMLAEGSVFQPVGAGPWGRLADVRPVGWNAHPVWRYGYACPVGVPQEARDA